MGRMRCILCCNDFKEESVHYDSQKLPEVCFKYLHSSITQEMSHSRLDQLSFCPKCFESAVELSDLNDQYECCRKRISDLVFIRSLEILHRRDESQTNIDDENGPNNIKSWIKFKLDVSALPNFDFRQAYSDIPETDVILAVDSPNVNTTADIYDEVFEDPLVIVSPDINVNTIDVTFEQIKVDRDEVDLNDDGHELNNTTQNSDADLFTEKIKRNSAVSTANTGKKINNSPTLNLHKMSCCDKIITTREKRDNFGTGNDLTHIQPMTKKAFGSSFKISDASNSSSTHSCFKGSSQNCCISPLNLEKFSKEQISEKNNTAGATPSGDLNNHYSHLVESVSKRAQYPVYDKRQQKLQEILPEIHSENNDSKKCLSKAYNKKWQSVLQPKLYHIDKGKTHFKFAVAGKELTQQFNPTKHVGVHFEERPYNCEICSKGFKNQYHMKKHKMIHTGEKPHQCEFCGSRFTRVGNLNLHVRIHTGEKPYKCDVCKMGFKQQYELTLHERVHTGEKPYNCEYCGKGFSQKGNMKNHVRIHTGEKPFKCDICKMEFSATSNLIRHRKIHF